MPWVMHRHLPRSVRPFGDASFVLLLALSGCPGMLDPDVLKMATGTGGNTGTGGMSSNCAAEGATIIMSTCAMTGCHDPSSATFSGGLDLTVGANIGSRLVGVMPGTAAQSACTGDGPYLVAGSNPATGLLIDKFQTAPPCGSQMPLGQLALTDQEQSCLIQWATTLTSP
jgi:hypothetical protein